MHRKLMKKWKRVQFRAIYELMSSKGIPAKFPTQLLSRGASSWPAGGVDTSSKQGRAKKGDLRVSSAARAPNAILGCAMGDHMALSSRRAGTNLPCP